MIPKRLAIAAAILATLLVSVRVVMWLIPSSARPLPTNRQLVVLLVPGLSTAEWTDARQTPTLAALTARSPIALLRTRSGERYSAAWKRAVQTIPDRGNWLEKSKVHAALLDENETAFTWQGPEEVLTFDQGWKLLDRDAPEGYYTDPDRFARAIVGEVRQPGRRTFLTVVYDDLDKAAQYAPLTMPRVALMQRQVVLRHFDALLSRLTASNGLPEDAALLLISPVSAEGMDFTPLVLWQRKAGERDILQSAERGATPGVLPLTAALPTAFAALGLSVGGAPAPGLAAGDPAPLLSIAETVTAHQHGPNSLLALTAIAGLALLAQIVLLLKGQKRVTGAVAAAMLTAVPLLYVTGSIPDSQEGIAVGLTAVGCLISLVGALFAPRRASLPILAILCLLTLLLFAADSLFGSGLAARSLLAGRSEGTATWEGIYWGLLTGAFLGAIYPALAHWLQAFLFLLVVAVLVLTPVAGIYAGLWTLFYGIVALIVGRLPSNSASDPA